MLEQEPTNFDAAHLAGVIAYTSNAFQRARDYLDRAIMLRPDSVDALSNLALTLSELHETALAIAMFDRAVAIGGGSTVLFVNRSAVLNQCGRFSDGLKDTQAALLLDPQNTDAQNNRAQALIGLGRNGEAREQYQEITSRHPEHVAAWVGLGNLLLQLDQFDDAQTIFEQVHGIAPRDVSVLVAFAALKIRTGDWLGALADVDAAIEMSPAAIEPRINRGGALTNLGRYREALEEYVRVLDLQPRLPTVSTVKGTIHLMLGEFQPGFELFEQRWQAKGLGGFFLLETAAPMLRPGDPLQGKSVVVFSDQGFGDAIQMLRFVPILKSFSRADVTLMLQPALHRLARQMVPGVEILALDAAPPRHDYRVGLLSLPWVLGTRPDTIPALLPPAIPQDWAADKSMPTFARPCIGLVWSGSATHKNDRFRSVPLELLAKYIPEGFDVLVLQKTLNSDETAFVRQRKWSWHPEIAADFAGTATLVALTQLVITVDTSVAHLAGCLNHPVSLLVAIAPDWRWRSEGSRSDWYPSITIYRQRTPGDWRTALPSLHDDLRQLLSDLQRDPNKIESASAKHLMDTRRSWWSRLWTTGAKT